MGLRGSNFKDCRVNLKIITVTVSSGFRPGVVRETFIGVPLDSAVLGSAGVSAVILVRVVGQIILKLCYAATRVGLRS